MNHLEEYNLYEGKVVNRVVNKPHYRFKNKFNPYSIANDGFLREVYCKDEAPRELTKGKKYRLYAEFPTGAMLSGKCFVVLTDNNHFIGFDSDYFIEEFEWMPKNIIYNYENR